MGLRLGIGKEKFTIYEGTGRWRPGRRRRVRGGGGVLVHCGAASPFPPAVVKGASHLLRPPGPEGTCQLPGKGALPTPIPSTLARTP